MTTKVISSNLLNEHEQFLGCSCCQTNLQLLNAALHCQSVDTAEGRPDGDGSESLRHGLTFPLLVVGDGAPSDGVLTKH